MKHIIKFWLISFIIVIVSIKMSAQGNNWNVVTISGDTLSNCLLHGLNDNLLTIDQNGILSLIPVDSITCLFIHKEPHIGTRAAIIGFLTGIVLGSAIGAVSSYQPHSWGFNYNASAMIGGGILGGLAGFTVGGTIGGSNGGNDVYDISARSHTQKVKIIGALMSR